MIIHKITSYQVEWQYSNGLITPGIVVMQTPNSKIETILLDGRKIEGQYIQFVPLLEIKKKSKFKPPTDDDWEMFLVDEGKLKGLRGFFRVSKTKTKVKIQ